MPERELQSPWILMEDDRYDLTQLLSLPSPRWTKQGLDGLYDLVFSGVVHTGFEDLGAAEGSPIQKQWVVGKGISTAGGKFVGHEHAVAAFLAWSWLSLRFKGSEAREPTEPTDARASRVAFWQGAVITALSLLEAKLPSERKPENFQRLWTRVREGDSTVLQRDWVSANLDATGYNRLTLQLLNDLPDPPQDQEALDELNRVFQEALDETLDDVCVSDAQRADIRKDVAARLIPASAQNMFGAKRGPVADDVLRLRDFAIIDAFMYSRWKETDAGIDEFKSLHLYFPDRLASDADVADHLWIPTVASILLKFAGDLVETWGRRPVEFVLKSCGQLEDMNAARFAATRTSDDTSVGLQAMYVHVANLKRILASLPEGSSWHAEAERLRKRDRVVKALFAAMDATDPEKERALLEVSEPELWAASLKVTELRAAASRAVRRDQLQLEEGDD